MECWWVTGPLRALGLAIAFLTGSFEVSEDVMTTSSIVPMCPLVTTWTNTGGTNERSQRFVRKTCLH